QRRYSCRAPRLDRRQLARVAADRRDHPIEAIRDRRAGQRAMRKRLRLHLGERVRRELGKGAWLLVHCARRPNASTCDPRSEAPILSYLLGMGAPQKMLEAEKRAYSAGPVAQRHGASYISDPGARLALRYRNRSSLSTYRFGHGTAQWIIC